jgi:hypothetical protein
MFTLGVLGTYFTGLANIQGQVPTCAVCSRSLSKSLWSVINHPSGVPSFWYIHCPKCHTSHIIFNSTDAVPRPPEPELTPSPSRSSVPS